MVNPYQQINEGRQQVESERASIRQQREEANKAREQVSKYGSKIPRQSQQLLRDNIGVQGLLQRRSYAKARESVRQNIENINKFEKQLSERESAVKTYEGALNEVEEDLKAQDLAKQVALGEAPVFALQGNALARKYYKRIVAGNNIPEKEIKVEKLEPKKITGVQQSVLQPTEKKGFFKKVGDFFKQPLFAPKLEEYQKEAISKSKNPIRTEIAYNLANVLTPENIVASAGGGSLAKFGEAPITIKSPIRNLAEPELFEVQTFKQNPLTGNVERQTAYKIKTEVRPPTQVLKNTGKGYIGSTDKLITELPKYKITKLEPTFETAPFYTSTAREKGGQVVADLVTGGGKLIDLSEISNLPKRQQYLLQKVAEARTGGRPVSIENVPKVLGQDKEYYLGRVNQQEFARLNLPRKEINMFEKVAKGTSTKRYDIVSELAPTKETPQYTKYEGRLFFLKQGEGVPKASGNVATLKQNIIVVKNTPEFDEGVTMLFGGQNPSSKQFFKQLYKPKVIPKAPINIPKAQNIKTSSALISNGESNVLSRLPRGVVIGQPNRLSDIRGSSDSFTRGFQNYKTQTTASAQQTNTEQLSDNIFNKEASKPNQKIKTLQDEIQKTIPKETFKQPQPQIPALKQPEIPLLKQLQIPLLKEEETPKFKAPDTSKPKQPNPSSFNFRPSKSNLLTKTKKGKKFLDGFSVFVRKNKKDVKIGDFSSYREATQKLFGNLRSTLRASGYVEKLGRKVKIDFPSSEFTTSKRDVYRVVQKRGRRLSSSPEVKEINYFKKRSNQGNFVGF